MSASVLISVAGGSASHPAAGGLRLYKCSLVGLSEELCQSFLMKLRCVLQGITFPIVLDLKFFSFEVAEVWCDVSASVCEDHLGD